MEKTGDGGGASEQQNVCFFFLIFLFFRTRPPELCDLGSFGTVQL